MPLRLRRDSLLLPLLACGLWLGVSQQALAGPPGGGGLGPTGPMGPTQAGQRDDKDGPAEEAPKDKEALRPIQPVPAQPRNRRRIQLFELHGYMRMRADYFHRINLGTPAAAVGAEKGSDFFRPPAETSETVDGEIVGGNQANCLNRKTSVGVTPGRAVRRCDGYHGLGGANMRLRLEPILHITDNIEVVVQADILDNLVLGSTPDSFGGENPWAPIDIYTRTQNPPQQGLNSFRDSITVKRAYGHAHFGWGLDIKFGRIPRHWGMGILFNHGNGYDRLERGDIVRMVDTDYGDSVDSVELGFGFGKDKRRKLVLGTSYDWAATGPTTSQLLGQEWDSGNRVAQDFSAEKYDNVHQFTLSLLRRDDPSMLRRKIATDEPVVNYGAITYLRWQVIDRAIGSPGLGDGLEGNPEVDPSNGDGLGNTGVPLGNGNLDPDGDSGLQNYANLLVQRRAIMLMPDLWLRVNWRTLRVEIEGAAVYTRFLHRDLEVTPDDAAYNLDAVINDPDNDSSSSFAGGYALEFKYGLFDDRFHLGLDQGFASGDGNENFDGFNYQAPLSSDGPVSRFRFNPAYIQDLLLFKEILGTAANAAYFKPWAAFYFFQGNMSVRADIEYAIGVAKTSTPNNNRNYGIELAGAARYHGINDPFFVQLQYGVMFPFKGLKVTNQEKAAQTVQAQIGIKF